MRVLPTLDEEGIFAFLALFDTNTFSEIELTLYNGTPSAIEQFDDMDVYVSRRKFTVTGKHPHQLKEALKKLDTYQIQEVSVLIHRNNSYRSCQLNAISCELTVHGLDTIPLDRLKEFTETYEIRRTTLIA